MEIHSPHRASIRSIAEACNDVFVVRLPAASQRVISEDPHHEEGQNPNDQSKDEGSAASHIDREQANPHETAEHDAPDCSRDALTDGWRSWRVHCFAPARILAPHT